MHTLDYPLQHHSHYARWGFGFFKRFVRVVQPLVALPGLGCIELKRHFIDIERQAIPVGRVRHLWVPEVDIATVMDRLRVQYHLDDVRHDQTTLVRFMAKQYAKAGFTFQAYGHGGKAYIRLIGRSDSVMTIPILQDISPAWPGTTSEPPECDAWHRFRALDAFWYSTDFKALRESERQLSKKSVADKS